DELVNGGVQHRVAGTAKPLVADDAIVIDQIEGGPAMDLPLLGDRSLRAHLAVPERAPGDALLLVLLLESFLVLVAVDAEESEGPAIELLHERPLVWEHRDAGRSPVPPEVEEDHLAPVVAELELLAVGVLGLDLGVDLANGDLPEQVEVILRG